MYRGKRAKPQKVYEGKIEPFKIADNLYFVGTYQASSHLIDTGEGLVLIDTGYENTLYLVIESVRKLGFNPYDIKYIVNTHWHWDHTEGSGMLADLVGAENVIGKEDAPYVTEYGYFTPDILVNDGDTLEIGNLKMHFIHTPGHTKGTMSLVFDTEYEGKKYKVGMHGGAGVNSLVPEFKTYYKGCRSDYLRSIERLEKEDVDIFIGNHCWNNDTEEKGNIIRGGGENKFIDKSEWKKFLNYCRERCENLGEEQ